MTPYEQLKKKFILPDAYDDWKEYRDFLTELVLSYSQDVESIAIIGAGRCNDIDLKRICSTFQALTLIDVDAASMMEAAAGLSVDERKNVCLKELSLTGISEQDAANICDSLLTSVREFGRNITAEAYTNILLQTIDEIERSRILPEELSTKIGRHDLILCSGVCSQLFSLLSYFIRSLTASVSEATSINMTDIQYLVDERFREMNDLFVPDIVSAVRTAADRYAIFGNEYSESSPVEGAHQCITALRKSGNVQKEIPARWNFNPAGKMAYDMIVQVFIIG